MTLLNKTEMLTLLFLNGAPEKWFTSEAIMQATERCNSSVTRAINTLAENKLVFKSTIETHKGQAMLIATITVEGMTEVRRYGKKAQFVNGVY